MPLDSEVDLVTGDMLDGDPAPPTLKDTAPPLIFSPCLLWPDGWMDQNATWYGGRPRPRPHCVRWGPSLPPKGAQQPPFSVHAHCGQMVAHVSYC